MEEEELQVVLELEEVGGEVDWPDREGGESDEKMEEQESVVIWDETNNGNKMDSSAGHSGFCWIKQRLLSRNLLASDVAKDAFWATYSPSDLRLVNLLELSARPRKWY